MNQPASDANLSNTTLTLSASTPVRCFNVSLIPDGMVEGTEILTLTLELESNIFGIDDIAPNTTAITILDGDCELCCTSMCTVGTSSEFAYGKALDNFRDLSLEVLKHS